MRYVLASASPRRREILDQIGFEYTVCVSCAEENSDETEPPRLVEELSIYKCQSVEKMLEERGELEGDVCIIGADTVVAYEGDILGKPEDAGEAFDMLKMLSGRTHQVYTGVTLLIHKDGARDTLVTFHEETDVVMRELDDYEIKDYIATGEPLDKAGAYGIQARAAVFVKEIRGDYYNVVGLPVTRLYTELRKLELL